ncbi:hypothetical protein C7212DRAFT_365296 [Tuber magnatum]|uniref:Uncharacterized protein n=1 Tax=Tuber magnatum TaxID=42249 RepID=A0A317SIJ3_9PEZI|nr:hypothetical protein C7212DRAFT_365296 [Tuber magnatum]
MESQTIEPSTKLRGAGTMVQKFPSGQKGARGTAKRNRILPVHGNAIGNFPYGTNQAHINNTILEYMVRYLHFLPPSLPSVPPPSVVHYGTLFNEPLLTSSAAATTTGHPYEISELILCFWYHTKLLVLVSRNCLTEGFDARWRGKMEKGGEEVW